MTTFNLKTETEALLRRLGAAELPDATGYPFTLLCTRGGPLHVHPLDTFIACRFEWVAIAEGRVGGHLNPHSGKWNHHPDGDPDRAFLDRFEAAVRAIG
jgi:hypothetical protein